MLCGACIQPKNQFKVQIIVILEEIDFLIDQKSTYEKVTKNLGRALPLLIWTKSERRAVFFRENVLYYDIIFSFVKIIRLRIYMDKISYIPRKSLTTQQTGTLLTTSGMEHPPLGRASPSPQVLPSRATQRHSSSSCSTCFQVLVVPTATLNLLCLCST